MDVFNTPGFSRAGQATLSLTQPPKWLRRPTSASFGYGGKIVSVSNLSGAHGKNQSSVVHIRKVTTEQTIADRARKLQEAVEKDTLSSLAEERSIREEGDEIAPAESASSWKALLSLFRANSRDELITLLGFSKSEIASRVAEAVANLKAAAAANEDTDSPTEHDLSEGDIRLHEPVVSFAEPEREPTPEYGHDHDDTLDAIGTAAETTPSEVSASATSDTTSATRLADGESTTTAPSLFGDDNIVNGTPQTDAAADFFGSIGTTRTEEDDQMQIPHHNYPLDSSVAATVGSRPSSVASESLKNNTFKIYPSDESETDRLVTKALVLGDFESAVSLCLSSDRFADAILLAVRGGPELLQKTQKAYFEKRTTALPYLRLFQSIVSNDLADIVQNADLQEWQEIFVVLCTFAGQDEFSSLAEQLGQRLEFQASLAKTGSTPEDTTRAREFRKNATLTYLAAGKLERLVNIWIDELAEEEKVLLVDAEHLDGSRYTAHALALQTFIEKVTVFRKAIKYADTDLEQQPKGISTEEAEVRVYKLSGLYDRYFEYADLLVAQGLVKEAVEFLKLTPSEYHGSPASHLDFKEGRERLLLAAGVGARTPSVPARNASLPAATSRIQPAASTSSVYGYGQYGVPPVQSQPPVARAPPATQTMYESYAPRAQHTGAYAPPPIAASSSQHLYGPPSYGHVNPVNLYAAQAPAPLAPPPAGVSQSQPNIPPPPPKGLPIKRDNGGWNDAPSVSQRRTPNSLAPGKPAAITSPFPNQTSPSTPPISAHGFGQGPISATLPPPPRPRSVQQRGPGQPGLPPPPPSSSTPGARIPGPPQLLNQGPPPHMRPLSGPPGPPPARMVSPPHGGPAGLNRPPPSQYMPAQQSPRGGQTLPPPPGQGPYIRATPSPGFHQGPPSGPYAPSSAQHPPLQQGSFSQPPQHQQQQHQQPGFAPPPPHSGGSFAPPPPPGVGAQGVFSPPPHQAGGSFAPPPPPQGAPRPGPPGPPPRGPGGQRDGAPSGSAPPPAVAAPPRKTGPPPPKYRMLNLDSCAGDSVSNLNVFSSYSARR